MTVYEVVRLDTGEQMQVKYTIHSPPVMVEGYAVVNTKTGEIVADVPPGTKLKVEYSYALLTDEEVGP